MLATLAALSLVAAYGGQASAEASPSHRGTAHASLTAAGVRPFTLPEGWGTTWSFNEFNPNFFGYFDDFVLLPLALPKPPDLDAYVPQLATSWSTSRNSITVHLKPNAVWQDGKPLTSSDVLTTLLLQGTDGNAIWSEISNVTTPNAHTLVFTLRPKQGVAVTLGNILTLVPVPNSQYGRFLVPDLKQKLLDYNSLVLSKGTSVANASADSKLISSVFNKVEKYAPSKLVGDGPFQFSRMNNSSSILTRSTTYWGAAKVHVPEIQFQNVPSNAAIYGGLFSHFYDWSTGAAPYNIISRWQNSSASNYALPPTLLEVILLFNSRKFPLNQVAVRQAIAYLVNRNTVNKVEAGGGDPTYTVSKYPDGLPGGLQSLYLAPRQVKSLNPYRPNAAEAAKLLRSAHLRKVGNRWLLPDGKPFTLNVIVPTGQNDSIDQMTSVADQLSAAGIKTTLRELEPAAYSPQIHAGNFELAWSFGGSGLDPLTQFEGTLVADAPQALGAYKGQPGIGFQANVEVPGLGKVNIVQTLQAEAAQASSKAAIKRFTWDWARMIDKQLPFLSLSAKGQQVFYSSEDYVDYPPHQNALWALVGYLNDQGLAVLIERGFIHPKGS